MSWNYRVVKHEQVDSRKSLAVIKFVNFGIHEAYYNKDGSVRAITVDPVCPSGETVKELQEDIKLYLKALGLPVLNYDDVESLVSQVGHRP